MKRLFTMLTAGSMLMVSCQKESLVTDSKETAAVVKMTPSTGSTATGRENCEPFPFALISLNNGSFSSSNLSVSGDIGYSSGVTSLGNYNLSLEGSCLVHSSLTNLAYSLTSSIPVAGILTNPGVDWRLDQTNTYANTLAENYKVLPADYTYSTITYNKTITANCVSTGKPNTVVNVTSVNLDGERITLVGAESMDEGFIINVSGSFSFNNSEIKLVNVRPERVLFNFPNNVAVQVKTDSKFRGTILAPKANVLYQDPALFEGSIVAKKITAVGGYSGGCGGSTAPSFVQRTYCNGYQW